MRLKADLTLFLISIIWGSAFVAQRVAGQMGGVYQFNGVRYLLAALVVLPFALRVGPALSRTPQAEASPDRTDKSRESYQWMFIAGFLLFLASALQQAGMLSTTAGNAGFITSLYVVLIPVLLFLFWGEKPHWLLVIAFILAGVGAFLLSMGGGPALSVIAGFEVHAGDALELAGALFWALHVIVLGKFASRFEPLSFSVGQLAVCGGLNLLVGLVTEPLLPLNGALWFAIAYTALLSLGLCYTLQVWAQRHTPPTDAALLLSLESVFAVLAGWLLLEERLVPLQLLGCALIFIAVLLSQFKEWTSGTIDPDHLVEGR